MFHVALREFYMIFLTCFSKQAVDIFLFNLFSDNFV